MPAGVEPSGWSLHFCQVKNAEAKKVTLNDDPETIGQAAEMIAGISQTDSKGLVLLRAIGRFRQRKLQHICTQRFGKPLDLVTPFKLHGGGYGVSLQIREYDNGTQAAVSFQAREGTDIKIVHIQPTTMEQHERTLVLAQAAIRSLEPRRLLKFFGVKAKKIPVVQVRVADLLNGAILQAKNRKGEAVCFYLKANFAY